MALNSPDRSHDSMKLDILNAIKKQGSASLKELAGAFSVSQEAVRKQVARLEAEGYVESRLLRAGKAGRPMSAYSLSPRGEELFPRKYDELAVALVDAISQTLDARQTRKVLNAIVEKKIRFWGPLVEGLSFEEKLEALKKIYLEDDSFMELQEVGNSIRLVESNCPYLKVAMHQPALCSITVTLLSRLLDSDVKRIEKFQDGHGRCTFEIKRRKTSPR